MWFVVPLGNNVIDLLGPEGGEDRREGDDETRCTEGVLLEAGVQEDGIREHRLSFCRDSGVLEGNDEDPFLGGDREGA